MARAGVPRDAGAVAVAGVRVGLCRARRALAIASERPLLFGDCHANPWTWLLAEPDGAIRHVWQSTEVTADGEETFDLAEGVDVWPLVIAPGDPLPSVKPDCADGLPRGCGGSGVAKCVVFQTDRCPRPTQYGEVRWRD